MAKMKLAIEITMILGFALILFGTLLLLVGAMRNNDNIILIGFIPLGLGILDYIVLITIIIIRLNKKKD